MPGTTGAAPKNVVLVHGAFADGSGWETVYRLLRTDGFTVSSLPRPPRESWR
jgi:hypothetical protein